MQSALLILGAEKGEFSKGAYNEGLFEAAHSLLKDKIDVSTTRIYEGFDVTQEIEKFKKSDTIIFQYPVFWFTMPPTLKSYLDQVYAYDEFYAFNDGPYGSGGLMKGKNYMLSTTWNAPTEAFNNPENDLLKGASIEDMILPMRKAQEYCGMTPLEHFSCHNVVKDPQFNADRERYIQHLTKTFQL